jgi:HSP20 family protein
MEQTAGDGKYHRREVHYGQFARQIVLPTSVDTERAEAHFENGVLKLRLPKAEQAKQRRIQVQTGTPTAAGRTED